MPSPWRRVQRHFGISAPRMAVRTRLPWWGRGALLVALLGVIAGMWWWGFDFGQIFGGFNRKQVEARLATLEADNDKLQAEAGDLRAKDGALESEIAMMNGKQEALSRQVIELNGENAQLKEELAFLQKLVSDTSKAPGLEIQRIAVEPDGEEMWRFSLLIVRGGSPKDDFVGNVVLRVSLAAADASQKVLQLPEDEPEASPALALKFKYYQRVEGRFRVPAGTRVVAVGVWAYESGQAAPRATRSLSLG
jgi:hypothetical protein